MTQNYNKVDNEKFEAYCEALSGGHFLENGDYMVATDRKYQQYALEEWGYELDSVEFAYPNMDLINGEMITDYPRAAELLAKYGVCYDNLLIGLDANYSLAFGYAYKEDDNSYDYFQQLLSGDKDNEIIYKLTGEWPD